MNTAIVAIPHPVLKDASGNAVLNDMGSKITDNDLKYEIDAKRLPLGNMTIKSPELKDEQRAAQIQTKNGTATLHINLKDINVYAVMG